MRFRPAVPDFVVPILICVAACAGRARKDLVGEPVHPVVSPSEVVREGTGVPAGSEFVAVVDDAFRRIDLGEMAVEVVTERGNSCCFGIAGGRWWINTLGVERPEIEFGIAAEETDDGDRRGVAPEK